MHRLAFAFVVPFGLAAIVAWAVAGVDGARTVGWVATLVLYLTVTGFAIVRKGRAIGHSFGWRPKVKPEDRERRRLQREARRRAREGAFGRYGVVVRGEPRDRYRSDA